MSYTFLQEQGEVSSVECFSDIPASVLSRLNLTAAKSSCNGSETESCPSSQSGMTCEPSMENRGKEKLTVVCGGFPCQDISQCNDPTGIKLGIEGKKSGLWKEFRRVVSEIMPTYILVENSPMLTIRGLGTVLRDLARMGYHAEWGMFYAAEVGLCHRRKRLFLVAYPNSQRQFPNETKSPELSDYLRKKEANQDSMRPSL